MGWAFVVPGKPVPWERAGRGRGRGHHFTLAKTARAEHAVAICALAAGVPRKLEGPLEVTITAIFPRLRSARLPGRARKATRGDVDNYAKQVLDGLKDHFDDGKVSDLHVHKRYAATNEQPCTLVEISQLTEEE